MAIAPQRSGIGIRRHFTTPGRHPYDTLEWDRRDSRIVHMGTGAVAFEQLGVEVPAGWSLNATNILAQKYFRGTLGTEEREWSLKQVVDRVVDTITGWGVKDGYFVDDEEAAAFSDELKYLVVHQKAAFNSPVWFNIGVKGVPQQGSACFILAVDDSMDSILNWYKEEGIIFKGGSGAGVNLSKIRSSKEGLTGGGTASGPVSFMRGADASAGTIKSGGKCFREGTLVATVEGWLPIEQLRIGDQVLTHRGPRPVADFMPNGVKQCYLVRTKEGYEVEVTSGHKFAFWNAIEGRFDVKPVEELSEGDALYSLLEPSVGGTAIALLPPQIADPPSATTTVEMRFPSELDDRLAYILGLTYGDAELRTTDPYRVRVAFAKDDPGRLSAQRFGDYSEQLFGERPILLDDERGHQQIGFTSKRLVDFLVVNGMAKARSDRLGFPKVLFRATPAVRAAFVAGLVDADGCFEMRGGWSIRCIDRKFLVEVQRLLLSLGIPSKLKLAREQQGTWRSLYRLDVVGDMFVGRFTAIIGDHSAKAQLAPSLPQKGDKGWGYRPSIYRPLIDPVQTRGAHRLVERRGGSSDETTGYGAVATLVHHSDAAVAEYPAELSTCVQLTIESIAPTGLANTFDIEVEDVHLLSANGIYASNTRRAAKMVILDADHPDIEDFIWCKAIEERKARALRDAGFDMDLDGKDSHSIQYQNANNSVRVTDEFMQAVVDDGDWHFRAVSTGEILQTVKARDLFRQIAKAAWECADPGMQFDTTINRWHTAPNTGRINASNPCCFVGETQVVTTAGSVSIADLAYSCERGDPLPEVRTLDLDGTTLVARPAIKAWVAGYTSELVAVGTSGNAVLRCTPEHRFLTAAGQWVEAQDLQSGSILCSLESTVSVVSVEREGLDEEVPVYDLEVEGTHNFLVEAGTGSAVVVHNSEYMHLDNSACNLASLNLLSFIGEDEAFDVEGFKAAVEVVFTAQEIIVGNADYPTEKIAENARRFRELGIGYANLGALLMAEGLPYDSEGGRAWAGALTALLTGHSYTTSARTAARMGPFAGYHDNREAMLDVLRMHREAASHIDEELVPPELLSAAQEAWDKAVETAEVYGVRNSQSSVLAPTGTIGLLLDCDTTGVEPDLSLVKMKKLVGGGTMSIVNQTVPRALRRLGYSDQQTSDIVAYVNEHKTIVGAPHLAADHLPVFACSMGDNTIHYQGHVRMMGAVQPFISGAISKTVNMPEEATVEDVEQLYLEAWQLGLKAVAIYRDNCKVAQPLATAKKALAGEAGSEAEVHDAELAVKVAELEKALERQTVVVRQPIRERLPRRRRSNTFAFRVSDCEGYVTVGEYDDGRPGEVFMKVSKQGSTLAGIMDAFSISVSLGLQHGVPLSTYVRKYTNMRFEPAGMTDDPELRIAQSLVDYIFRRLAVDYLPDEERQELGVLTTAERTQQPLPGIEEAVTANTPFVEAALPAAGLPSESDAPYCFQCGVQMMRSGSCHACPSCGTTSGCS